MHDNTINAPASLPAGVTLRGIFGETITDGCTVTFTNNTINGGGILSDGYYFSYTPSPNVRIVGGSVHDVKDVGVLVGYNHPQWGVGDTRVTIDGMSIDMAPGGVGVKAWDDPSAASSYVAQVTLAGGTSITGGATGVLIDGSQASLGGSTLNDTAFSDQSGDYIVLANGAMANLEIDGTAATFGGKTGQQMETADGSTGDFSDLYAVEDKIVHAIDNSSLGLVRVTEGYLYVTPNSYVSPDTRRQPGPGRVGRGRRRRDPRAIRRISRKRANRHRQESIDHRPVAERRDRQERIQYD